MSCVQLDEDLRLSSERGEKLTLSDFISFAFQISDGMVSSMSRYEHLMKA